MKCLLILVSLFALSKAQWTAMQYNVMRRTFIFNDTVFGMLVEDQKLDEDETMADEYFVKLSEATAKEKKEKPESFAYESMYFGNAKDAIEKTEEFDTCKELPKGAAMNVEVFGTGSTEMLLGIMAKQANLYVLTEEGQFKQFEFIYDSEKITDDHRLVSDLTSVEDKKKLREMVTITPPTEAAGDPAETGEGTPAVEEGETEGAGEAEPKCVKEDLEANWKQYENVRANIKYVVTHQDIFEQYLKKSLIELHDDKVSYVELRTAFDELKGPDADKKKYIVTVNSTAVANKILFLARQLRDSELFTTIRVVYTPKRDEQEYVSKFKQLQQKPLGVFLTGFDFDGREDEEHTLKASLTNILEIAKFYKRFHFTAGNSITAGTVEDENLMDAILIGSERINGGVSIVNHPFAIQEAKAKNITFVIDPIKYNFLGYGRDNKNHPIATMIGNGLRVVIGCGAPGMFGGKGVSHNYYYAMKAARGKYGGIKVFKRFLRNGLNYNRMTDTERLFSEDKWKKDWGRYCRTMSRRKPKSRD